MTGLRFLRTAAAAAVALAALSACGSQDGSQGDAGAGDPSGSTSPSAQEIALPADLPADIPMLDGTVASVDEAEIGKGRKQWEVDVLVDGPEDPFYGALDQLRASGFEAGDDVGVMTRGAQEVHVTSLPRGDRFEVSYLVMAPVTG